MKHYKSVEFFVKFECQSPPAQTKSPPIHDFLATFFCPKSNTDETQKPKQVTNNYCIWSPSHRSVNNWGKM